MEVLTVQYAASAAGRNIGFIHRQDGEERPLVYVVITTQPSLNT